MLRAADAARSIAMTWRKGCPKSACAKCCCESLSGLNPIEGMSKQEKIALLESIDKEARRLDPR